MTDEYIAIKAVADSDGWVIDVLGVPFGGPNGGKDSDGEFFSENTNLELDRFSRPLVTYYHSYGPNDEPQGEPETIGEVESHTLKSDGHWFRVALDRASKFAHGIRDAVLKGVAGASSGTVNYLKRKNKKTGEILYWPLVELTLLDTVSGWKPRNGYAVALPAAQKAYQKAGRELPDLSDLQSTPEAEVEAESNAPAPARADDQPNKEITMDEIEVKNMVADAIKADREARAEEEKAAAARKAEVDAAVEAAKKEWQDAAAKANRLPTGEGAAPAYLKHADTRKYDNLTPGEHAFFIQTYETLRRQRGGNPLSDAALKAFAMKAESEAEKGDQNSQMAIKAMRDAVGPAMKAYEINYSTYSGYGDQWVGVLYHSDLWEKIRANTWVLQELERGGDVREVPQGFESDVVPLESGDPTWYNVAQATAHDATSGRPVATITSSKIGTAQKAVTLGKVGCRVIYSGEMVEDSLIPWVANAYRQIQRSGQEQMEYLLIDGDTTTTQYLNINDEGGTPTAGDLFLNLDGFRHLCLVTNTANARDGGALTVNDFLDTVKLMGVAGIGGADPTKVGIIVDPHVYWKALELDEVKTKDVFAMPTIENGLLTGLWGYPLRRSYFMCYAGVALGSVTTDAYKLKSNSTGFVDQTTEANNTKGSILAVRWDQWALRWKRRMTLEAQRWPEADASQIVAMMRFGLGYRDTEAAALTYNITV